MEIQSVTLKRGGCNGTCPIYSVTVQADGSVTWIGELYVETIGEDSWSVPVEDVRLLGQAIERYEFFAFHDEYTHHTVTCAPTYKVTVALADGRVKKVEHYAADMSEPRLKWLEDKIDELANTRTRIGRDPG